MHLHWSIERNGCCPQCDGETALLVGSQIFDVDEESPFAEQLSDGVETGCEVTLHWCPECLLVCAMAVNCKGKTDATENQR